MTDTALFEYALRLGDDSMILGQRLSEWCGYAPALEVDLSLSNLALDLVGQATSFLDYAGVIEGAGRDADRLAFHRDVLDYRNCLLVEQPNGDFGQTIARQFLFSTWQHLYLQALSRSTDTILAAIAGKAVKEVAYHAEIATDWVIRLGDGTEESHARVTSGLDWNWRFVDELFTVDAVDGELLARGIAVDQAALRPAFDEAIGQALTTATLTPPASRRATIGGRSGSHSEHLGHILSEMQFLQRAYPGVTW
jgi:ring-1,2-phenylacetyl-CoA epoxidase subunit PaaC